ncbi:hypothetical protein DFH94DRAFT_785836, partial [Russula ochroleuca]
FLVVCVLFRFCTVFQGVSLLDGIASCSITSMSFLSPFSLSSFHFISLVVEIWKLYKRYLGCTSKFGVIEWKMGEIVALIGWVT